MTAARFLLLLMIGGMFVGVVAGQVPEPPAPPTEAEPSALPLVQPDLPTPEPRAVPPGFEPLPGFPPEPTPLPPGFERPVPSATLTPARQSSTNPLLRLFDTDGDGMLSGDEVEAAPARLWDLDRNLDAELSAGELALVLAPRWDERRRGVPGHLPVEPITPTAEPPAMPAAPAANAQARFQVYPLHTLDPQQTLAKLQTALAAEPDVRITVDRQSRSLLALAPPDAQRLIRDTLAQLHRDGVSPGRAVAPGIGEAAPMPALPRFAVPRTIPLYATRASDIVRIVKQVYAEQITEPDPQPARRDPRFPDLELPAEPELPEGTMVIGIGRDPNTVVVTADDELFFDVLELIERLDAEPEPEEE